MYDRFNFLLKSLAPITEEDQGVLDRLLQFARAFVGEPETDLALAARRFDASSDLLGFFENLSGESARYFFGLVEALEIYMNVRHDYSVLSIENPSHLDEIRQLRDHCLSGVVSPSL